jgi:hypothetical protein
MANEDTQSADQVVQQAAQSAEQAAQEAKQAAQQLAEAVQQAARGVGAETSAATIETEVSPASITKAWAGNFKRTYDEFQDISLVAARRSQVHFDEISHLSVQALQNAVTTSDMIAKQAVEHRALASDRQWNVDEVSTLTAKSGVQADAFVVALAQAITLAKTMDT